MAECCRCGGWIELGINDVHGHCHRCEEHVGNVERMHLCGDPDCPMCDFSGVTVKIESCTECRLKPHAEERGLVKGTCDRCGGTGLIIRRSYRTHIGGKDDAD